MIFQNCTHLKWDTVGFYFLEIINFSEEGTIILRNTVKCCRMSVKKKLIRALEDADVVKVKEIIENESNESALGDESMDIISCVCDYMTKERQEALPHLVTSCQDILAKVTLLGNPKELLVSMLEQLDGFKDTCSVVKLLPSLAVILRRVKLGNMSVSWNWALNTVSCHLRTCPTPGNMGLEAVERVTIDQTSEAGECLELCEACVDMAGVLVQVTRDHSCDRDNVFRRAVILSFLLEILVPLSTLPQHIERGVNGAEIIPQSRHVCDKLIKLVYLATTGNLWTDVIYFSECKERKLLCEQPVSPLSTATVIYLVMCEEMCQHQLPSVYTHYYLLRSSAASLVSLLQDNNQIRVHKALLLLSTLLNKIELESLSSREADDPELISLVAPLVQVIVYNEVEELRKHGFTCYQQFIKIFHLQARYKVYFYLFKTVNHSGLLGWTTTSLKDTIARCLSSKELIKTYSGDQLSKILLPLLKLKHGPETDLLEISEELLATLNFVQFLLVRDKANLTGICGMKTDIVKWVEDVTTGVQMAEAHYKQKLTEQPLSDNFNNCGVTVGGQQLPPMSTEQLQNVLKSALNTFNLILFNLGRVRDLL